MTYNKEQKNKLYTVLSLIMIIVGGLFIIWRAPYGYFFNDEPFCITLAQRLSFGDKLISDEWNACQNVGILLLPFYKMFHAFFSNNDGILLTFRYIYCALWFMVCLTVFLVFRKRYRCSIVIFLYLILFSPLDYMTLSYTSISLMACILICTLFYYTIEFNRLKPIIFSFLFSLLSCIFVLCYPYLAVIYLLAFVILLLMNAFFVKDKSRENYKYWNKCAIYSFCLILSLGSVYIITLVIKDTPVESIITSIPFVFSSPEHEGVTSVLTIFKGLYRIIGYSRLFSLLIFITIIYSFLCRRFPKLYEYRIILFAAVAVYYIRCQYIVCTKYEKIEYNTLNQQILGIAYLGIAAYALLKNKPKSLFLCFVPLSVLYAVFTSISSNTGMLVIAMALCVCGIPGIVFIALLCKEFAEDSKLRVFSYILLSAIFVFQISSEVYTRLTRFYWEEPMKDITCTIDCGAGKGIVVSKGFYDEYTSDYTALNNLLVQYSISDSLNGKHFISLKSSPVIYLDADLPYGVYSSWTFRMTPEWLETYYTIHPERVAELVFTDEDNDFHFTRYFDQTKYDVIEYGDYKLYYFK